MPTEGAVRLRLFLHLSIRSKRASQASDQHYKAQFRNLKLPPYTGPHKTLAHTHHPCFFSQNSLCDRSVSLVGPVQYSAADLIEKNAGGVGQNLLDLLDDACTNEVVGERSRSRRYRSAPLLLYVDDLAVL